MSLGQVIKELHDLFEDGFQNVDVERARKLCAQAYNIIEEEECYTPVEMYWIDYYCEASDTIEQAEDFYYAYWEECNQTASKEEIVRCYIGECYSADFESISKAFIEYCGGFDEWSQGDYKEEFFSYVRHGKRLHDEGFRVFESPKTRKMYLFSTWNR